MNEPSEYVRVMGWILLLGGVFGLGVFFARAYDWGLGRAIDRVIDSVPIIAIIAGIAIVLSGVYLLAGVGAALIIIGMLIAIFGALLI